MTAERTTHALSYFAVLLSDMTSTLRDFEMHDTAALLEQAKSNIEQVLAKDPEKPIAGEARKSVREARRH